MSGVRTSSSSAELSLAPTTSQQQQQQRQRYDDAALQGVAANLKLLLKLIQEHKDACYKEKNDHRRMLRVATMMTILDTVRARIQKCQSFGNKRSKAELQRCNTDLSLNNNAPKDKRHSGELVVLDEKEKLRRELNASLAARKSLQIMCSSLGKEKEIMAAELSRKVQELNGMDELINDLKAQNEMLLEKVRECALQHTDRKCFGGFGGGGGEETQKKNAALQEQNKVLSERLSRALDRYRLMKWKLKEAQEENMMMRSTVDEMGSKVITSLKRVRSFKEHMSCSGNVGNMGNFREEIVALESMFESFAMLVPRYDQRPGEIGKLRGKISACMSSFLTREEEVT